MSGTLRDGQSDSRSGATTPSGPAPASGRRVVTIDGPAGSGKSTTAKEVSRRLGFLHLDSGALYRALTLGLLRKGLGEEIWDGLESETFSQLEVTLEPREGVFEVLLDGGSPGDELRSPHVTRLVPHLARLGPARARLLELQRSAPRFGGVVADGRDMGTVIFPDAPFKFFLTASLEERARRRMIQERRVPDPALLADEARRIEERDESDAARALAPLLRPDDAVLIDTTALDFGEQVDRIIQVVLQTPPDESGATRG